MVTAIRKVFIQSFSQQKMLQSLLKEAVIAVAGAGAAQMADLLFGKENVNEFDIAGKLKITINQARNLLYKMADEGLVTFTRKKDKKNGGWYTYFWTLDEAKSLEVLRKKILNEIEQQEQLIDSKRTKQFYYCPNCDIEMTEENALLQDFACPECGEILQLKDNSEVIAKLEGEVAKLRQRVSVVDGELAVINEKAAAATERRNKREEKKKKAERAAKRAATKALNAEKGEKKPAKKAAIKKPEKKPAKKTNRSK